MKSRIFAALMIAVVCFFQAPSIVAYSQAGQPVCGLVFLLDAGTRRFPMFKPYGTENDPNQWMTLDNITGVQVKTTGEIFNPQFDRYVLFWNPHNDDGMSNYISIIDSYQYVDSCAPKVAPSITPMPPTNTFIPPTYTPVPTWTPVPPTNTPRPTLTPIPATDIPLPTWTPIPPTEPAIPTTVSAASPNTSTTNSFQLLPSTEPLPLDSACVGNVIVTFSDMPADWQAAARAAATSWNEADSNLKISGFNSVTDSQREITPLDYNGNAMPWYPGGTFLKLAKCEIRILLSSTIKDQTMDLPGLDMPYSFQNSKLSIGSIVIINNRNFNWTTNDTTPSNSLDAQSIILHELGHALGLVHVKDVDAVMNGVELNHLYQLLLGVQKRSLTDSDLQQLVNLYKSSSDDTVTNVFSPVKFIEQAIQDFSQFLFRFLSPQK